MITAGLFFITAAFGAALGSFLNAAAYRTVRDESFYSGRSRCPRCRVQLRWFELIPLVSYMLLRGRCRNCRASISPRYILVEIAVAALLVLLLSSILGGAFRHPFLILFSGDGGLSLMLSLYLLVSAAAVMVFLVDLETRLIPVGYTRLLSGFGMALLLVDAVLLGNFGNFFSVAALSAGIGAFFFLISRATGGRGMGEGDAELAFFLSLFLPFPQAILMLLLSFWIGAVVGIILILQKDYSLKSQIPFGPFLILGFFIALFWGGTLLPRLFPMF